jgi:hypothetical protein
LAELTVAGSGGGGVCLPERTSDLSGHLQTLAQLDGLEVFPVDALSVVSQVQ